MKVAILDRKALESLPPLDVAAYLRLGGWKEEPYGNLEARVWRATAPDGQGIAALQPLTTEFDDYADRMAEVLHALERREQRSQLAIYTDVMTVHADVIRIAVLSDEASSGTISLEEGAQLVNASRSLIFAAACSATAPKPAWLRRRPESAVEYLRRTRLGQTEHGSFVVRVLSKVPPTYDRGQVDPFERQVTRMLASGLAESRLLAQAGDIDRQRERLLDSVHRGVSYNLCESIGALGSGDVDREVHLSIGWSPTRAVAKETPSSFRFTPDTCAYIRAVGRLLRQIAPQEDFEVEGQVVRLDQSGRAERITVRAAIDGAPRNVRLELPEEFRDQAIRAYDQRSLIRCEGELVSEGRGFRLDHVRGFELVPSDEAES